MPDPALTPDAALERLGETSQEVRAAILVDEGGGLIARTGAEPAVADGLGRRTAMLLRAAELAAARAGLRGLGRVQVSRPEGAVFCVRAPTAEGREWTLLAIAAAGALPALVLYDMRMTLFAAGARP